MTRYERHRQYKVGDKVLVNNKFNFALVNLIPGNFSGNYVGTIVTVHPLNYKETFCKPKNRIPSDNPCYRVENNDWDWMLPQCMLERIS